MKTPKRADPIAIYARMPTAPDYPDYVILPLYRPHRHWRRRCLLLSISFLLAAAACYLIFPSDLNLTLVRLRFNRVHIQYPLIDLSLSLLLRVFNRDFFSLNYSSLRVSVEYRQQMLGYVTWEGGHVRARGTLYVNAMLDLDGLQVIHDAVYLIEDLAKCLIPLDTDTDYVADFELCYD